MNRRPAARALRPLFRHLRARPRRVHSARTTWYLARAESVNHVIVTTVKGPTRSHVALDRDGIVFDAYP